MKFVLSDSEMPLPLSFLVICILSIPSGPSLSFFIYPGGNRQSKGPCGFDGHGVIHWLKQVVCNQAFDDVEMDRLSAAPKIGRSIGDVQEIHFYG